MDYLTLQMRVNDGKSTDTNSKNPSTIRILFLVFSESLKVLSIVPIGTVRGETFVCLSIKAGLLEYSDKQTENIIISQLKRSMLCYATPFSVNPVERKKGLNKQLVVLLQSCGGSSCRLMQVIAHLIPMESLQLVLHFYTFHVQLKGL